MTGITQATLSPIIKEKMDDVLAAEAALASAVGSVQEDCPHLIVSECDWRGSDYFRSFNARRICNHCRFEEEGSHWSGGATWSKHDHSKSELGNIDGRLVVKVSRDELYAMRVI